MSEEPGALDLVARFEAAYEATPPWDIGAPGFHHRLVESWTWRGRYYVNKRPSARAIGSIRAKVRERTDRRYASASMEVTVGLLNPVLRGWGNYFRHGNSSRQFHTVDSYVHQRLARLACIKHGLQGINWANRFDHRWLQSLGVHQLTGTVGPWGAHA
jgi:Group II intron, maturase-specific domain